MSGYSVFTSESVSRGHPDKIADQVSDAVLDALLTRDPQVRTGVETLVKTGMVTLAGEIRSSAPVDTGQLEEVVRNTILDIGYDSSALGFDGNSCAVLNALGQQSPDIAMGVDRGVPLAQGAGDQGMMFGYASDETPSLMPAPIYFAHRLMEQHARLRSTGKLPWLRPDAKSQLSIRYADGRPCAVEAVVFSTQHDPDIAQEELRSAVIEEILQPVLPTDWLNHGDTVYHINPTGQFIIGGPLGDCGLTGRKIIVDTYGGMARHGGGAFSGKDPSKVDRSGAYAARHVAKNIVAAGLARRCEVQVSYAIGVAVPTSVNVNTFGSGVLTDEVLEACIREVFDLRPGAIIEALDLLRPIYLPTAAHGHFGREGFPWEHCDRVQELQDCAGVAPAEAVQQ